MAYKNFPGIAFAPGRNIPLSTKSPFHVMKEPLYEEFQATGLSDIDYIKTHATQRGVKTTRRNINISLEKCDVPVRYPCDEIQEYAEELAFQYLGPYLTVPIVSTDHKYELNMQASPAKYWKRKGAPSKGEAVIHPDFIDMWASTDHVPICDYNGKTELLEVEEIDAGKIRGTFNPPLDFIMKQKLLYDNQNAALLDNNDKTWIKYGFVKQHGGFDSIGKKLQTCTFISEDDCKGYDRNIFLEPTYRLRNRCLIVPDSMKILLSYVLYWILFPMVACPDGVIRQRGTGNISGSNNTTVDNSIAHVIIMMRFMCKLWLKFMGKLPTLEEITQSVCCYIYSDDNTTGYKLPFDISLEEFTALKRETYAEFGLILKPEQSHITFVVNKRIDENHTFLGSSFHFDETLNSYIPFPRINKIASSLVYTVDKKNEADVLCKMFSLCVLSSMVPKLGEECRNFTRFLLGKVKDPHLIIGFDNLKLINSALSHPRQFYLQLVGRQCSNHFTGGRKVQNGTSKRYSRDRKEDRQTICQSRQLRRGDTMVQRIIRSFQRRT